MIFRSIRKGAATRPRPVPLMGLIASVLALMISGGADASGDAMSRTEPANYPSDPADEAAQIAAHGVAFLYCTCVFVEKSDPKRCDHDLPAGMTQVARKVDHAGRRVTAVAGSRIAIAKDAGAGRGCVFQPEPEPAIPTP